MCDFEALAADLSSLRSDVQEMGGELNVKHEIIEGIDARLGEAISSLERIEAAVRALATNGSNPMSSANKALNILNNEG